MLGGKRLKSPSGFQSERCHQHMCSRHVGGGGSINEGASLSNLLRHPSLSGNFISHNRALKPPLCTSFTLFPSFPPFYRHLSHGSPPFVLLALLSFYLRFFRRGRVFSSFRYQQLSTSYSSSAALASHFRIYELPSLFFPSILCPSLYLSLFLSFISE